MRNSRSVANGVANDAFLTLFALVSKGLSVWFVWLPGPDSNQRPTG